MMKFIKHNLSFILGAVLLLLMYNTPETLKNISKTIVGRVLLVSILSYFALFCDIACAIIFATIIIILLHGNKEGFKEGSNSKLDKLVKASIANADRAEEKLGFGNKEGLPTHTEKDHDDEEDEKEKKGKENFIGMENIKHVTEKLQNYLGFSIIDLDRFMKTSSEKNTISATKDLQ
jgi:hypothetical protein